MTGKLLSSKEASIYIDVSYRSLLESKSKGKLNDRKPPDHVIKGRYPFYKKKDLDDWLENKKPTERKLW